MSEPINDPHDAEAARAWLLGPDHPHAEAYAEALSEHDARVAETLRALLEVGTRGYVTASTPEDQAALDELLGQQAPIDPEEVTE